MDNNFGSGGRKKNYIISHSGKFKSRNKKRITITDDIWIGPENCMAKVCRTRLSNL